MIKKGNNINVWYVDLPIHQQYAEELSAILKSNNIVLQRYNAKSEEEFGIVLVAGREYYEQLISF